MTPDRLQQLLEGPLNHPLIPFRITRLVLALVAVVEATGRAGEEALEAHCRQREARDFYADRKEGGAP